MISPHPNPESLAITSQSSDAVMQALAAIPPAQRVALELAFFAGLTHAEVAEQLGEPLVRDGEIANPDGRRPASRIIERDGMLEGGEPMQLCNSDHASLYALGLLDEVESDAFEQHLALCSFCAGEARASSGLAAQLASVLPASAPPAELRHRVLTQAVLPRGVLALVRRDRIDWQPTGIEGVSIARLFEDPARGELSSLVRMLPGAYYPSHRHASIEHC